MRMPSENTSQLPLRLLLIGSVMLLVYAGITDLVGVLARLSPQVGDIIAFQAGRNSASDLGTSLTVARFNGQSCILDFAVLNEGSGSLIVEQRSPGPNRLYLAHWAGPRTSRDASDCGAAADLLLRRSDLNALRMMAGGPDAVTVGSL